MDFISLDVETTGTLPYMDHIVEIAAVRFSEGSQKEAFCSLVNPNKAIPPQASKINGITNDMVKNKPLIAEILPAFSKFCGSFPLVAHNAIFDFQFLSTALEKAYCTAPTGYLFDTYTLSKKIFIGLSNYKLSTVAEHLKISSSNFHRAEQDAWVCGEIFNRILNHLSKTSGQILNHSYFSEITGKKALKFPALKEQQCSFF